MIDAPTPAGPSHYDPAASGHSSHDIQAMAASLRQRLDGRTPTVLMTLGSGLGSLADDVTDRVEI
ncbi:MAG TPA: hypothetical protein VMM13_12035, partial [Euzebya sp.]|nr:hypothetical protein [Euzebya sp.]